MDSLEILNVYSFLFYLDLLGTLAFAISGAMAAANKKLDLFGAAFLAFVTAVGGGTVRDLLLGITPVGWMQNFDYIIVILIGVVITYLFQKYVRKLRRTLFLFDTIGISVFTILGVKKALLLEVDPAIAVIMGMFSAILGGVIRDMSINLIPMVFRKEIYALACIIGGALFVLLESMEVSFEVSALITILTIITIRIISIRYKLGLSGINDRTRFPFKKSDD